MATINFLKELLKHLIAKRKTQVYYWRNSNANASEKKLKYQISDTKTNKNCSNKFEKTSI